MFKECLKGQAKSSKSVGLLRIIGFVFLHEDATSEGEWSCCGVSCDDSHCEW